MEQATALPLATNTGETERNPQIELRSLNSIISALQDLPDNSARERVIQAAEAFLGMSIGSSQQLETVRRQPHFGTVPVSTSFSEDRTISPKEFLIQKQPQTEVERVACLAYYLTHYRDTPHFKTIDVSTLNTEAAQPKFGNTAQAVDNALKTHYLAAASKGQKQLSAAGEVFVQALPDRERARAAMATMKPRRRKKVGQATEAEDASGDE